MKLSRLVFFVAVLFAVPAFGQTTAGLQSVLTATPFLVTDANCSNGYLYESADGTFTCDSTFQYAGPGSWNYYDQNGNPWAQVSPYAVNYSDPWGNTEFWFDTSDQTLLNPINPIGGGGLPPQGTGGALHIYDNNNDDTIDLFGGSGNGYFTGGVTAITGIADASLGASTNPICTGPGGVFINVGCSGSGTTLPADIDYIDQAQTISGQKFFTTPVAIGTTTPQSALMYIGGGPGNTFLNLYNGYGYPQENSVANILFSGYAAPNGFATIQGGGDPCCYSSGAGFLSFQTAQSAGTIVEAMRINAGGGVGIGTPNPQNYLSVSGGLNLDQNDADNGTNTFIGYQSNLGISFGDSSGEAISSARATGAPNQYGLDFYTSFQKRFSITSTGNVGVGTATPGSALEVNGNIAITRGSSGVLYFADGTSQSTAATSGYGSGSATISASNFIAGPSTTGLPSNFTGALTIASPAPDGQGQPANGILFVDNANGAAGAWTHAAIYTVGSANYNGSLVFATDGDNQDDFGLTESMRLSQNGNLGIGTPTPGARLEVNGSLKLTANSGASMTFQDGSVQTVAWNGTTLGGDYAESIDVLGDRTTYEPGDVIAIDGSSPGMFLKSAAPYSKLVAGVYSTKPGLVGRRTTAARIDKNAEVPMAMMGIAPTKVNTENGPIEPGDLLVTSSRPGYAMKATDPSRTMGAVIGKALAPLKSGSGVIEVLISLQ